MEQISHPKPEKTLHETSNNFYNLLKLSYSALFRNSLVAERMQNLELFSDLKNTAPGKKLVKFLEILKN